MAGDDNKSSINTASGMKNNEGDGGNKKRVRTRKRKHASMDPSSASKPSPAPTPSSSAASAAASLPPPLSKVPAGCFKVFVGNLPFSVTKEDIRSLLKPAGNIWDVRISTNPATGACRGFAHVEFENELAVGRALDMKNTKFKRANGGKILEEGEEDRVLVMSIAVPKAAAKPETSTTAPPQGKNEDGDSKDEKKKEQGKEKEGDGDGDGEKRKRKRNKKEKNPNSFWK